MRALLAILCLCACDAAPLPVGPTPADASAARADVSGDAGPDAGPGIDALPAADADGGDSPADANVNPADGSTDAGADSGGGADAAPAADAGPAVRVYYVATTGDDARAGDIGTPLRTIAAALGRAQPGEIVRVRAGTYAELVSFPRSGQAGQPITLEAMAGERVVLDATGIRHGLSEPALVMIIDREHLIVRGLELTGLTGTRADFPSGIWVRGTNRDIRLERNLVHGIRAFDGGDNSGAHGIAVYGNDRTPTEDIVLEGNEVRDLVLGWSEAVVINGNVRRFLIEGNLVHRVNNIAFDVIGFEEDVCPRCDQADVVSDVVNRARDGRLVGNVAHSMTTRGNPAYGNTRSAACYYVDGGADIVIERNLARECDLGVELASEHYRKSTRRVTVRSNILHDNWVTGVATGGYDDGTGPGGGSAEDCVVVHNTISNSARDSWADAGIALQNRNIRNVFSNNIVVATPGTFTMASLGRLNTGLVFSGNIDFGGDVDGITRGPGSQRVDPRFVDAARGNFHLAAQSPARDTGVMLDPALTGALDFDGDARLQGARLDVGADEAQ